LAKKATEGPFREALRAVVRAQADRPSSSKDTLPPTSLSRTAAIEIGEAVARRDCQAPAAGPDYAGWLVENSIWSG
jgi:hypothetical protein